MKRNNNYLIIYKQRFLGGQPICWRLLRSVVRRINILYEAKNNEFPKTESKELKIIFTNLCDKIMEASRRGEILPRIPYEYKMFPLKITWKRI
jgi:hypothetical protein